MSNFYDANGNLLTNYGDIADLVAHILHEGVYVSNQTTNIVKLQVALGGTYRGHVVKYTGLGRGSVSFDGSQLIVNATPAMAYRATLLPAGNYLRKGKKYRFSIGDLSSAYQFGLMIMKANGANDKFEHVTDMSVRYPVNSLVLDTGWQTNSYYEYIVTTDNVIFSMNFGKKNGGSFTQEDYNTILANLSITDITYEDITLDTPIYEKLNVSLRLGSTNCQTGQYIGNTGLTTRATFDTLLMPLEANKTYRIRFDNIAGYSYGVQTFDLDAHWEPKFTEQLTYSEVNFTNCLDSGWIPYSGYEFTAPTNHAYFNMNFKRNNEAAITEEDLTFIEANVVIEEVL